MTNEPTVERSLESQERLLVYMFQELKGKEKRIQEEESRNGN